MTDSFASHFEDDFGTDVSKAPAARRPVDPKSSAHPTAPSMDAAFTRAYSDKCTKCRGTGLFVSWSGRVLGGCFVCKGKGEIFYKTNAADRAAKRAQAADRKASLSEQSLANFAAEHPSEWAWIEGNRSSFAFAQSMHDAITKWNGLTANQLAACTRAAEKVAARQADRAAAVEAAPVIDMTKIEAAFAAARSSGLKSLKLRIGDLVISPAKATSANAGALYVKSKGSFDNSTYFGKIMGGKFLKSRDCDAATEALIITAATDPLAAAIAYGRATGQCSCCGRELTNKISIDLGIGPVCRAKWGLG
jgi:hypothetical protein